MSLARTALRLAVIEALKADSTITALCEDRIYDSLIQEFDSAQPVPMIVVLTEEDGGKAYSANNGGVPFDEICVLLLEIAVRQIVQDDADPQIAIPQTDRELEAAIDLIEYAALNAITVADTDQSRLVRQAVTRRATKYESVRFASDQTGMKLAVREVQITLELKGETVRNPLDVPTGPYANLPDPLRSVCAAMPTGSSGEKTCQMLAAAIAGTTPEPFAGATVWTAIKRPSYPPAPPLPATDINGPDPFVDTIILPPGPPQCEDS